MIIGTPGNDVLTGGAAGDSISGLAGDDLLDGSAGADTLDGGGGNDVLYVYDGADVAHGGDGDDAIDGADGDQFFGDAGNDTLSTNIDAGVIGGVATLDGGSGHDLIFVYSSTLASGVTALGGDGDDIISIEGRSAVHVDGGAGDDVVQFLDGESQATVTLGAGVDTLNVPAKLPSLPAASTISDFTPGMGGDHIDIFDYLHGVVPSWNPGTNPFAVGLVQLVPEGSSTVFQVNLNGGWHDLFVLEGVSPRSLVADNFVGYSPSGDSPTGTVLGGTSGSDSLTGTVGGDTVQGGDGGDTISGSFGDDVIDGGAGGDSIDAGQGVDVVYGGEGSDSISDLSSQFDTYSGGEDADRIYIYQPGVASPPGDIAIDGGGGDDTIHASAVSVWTQVHIWGGPGIDTIDVSKISGQVDAGDGDDLVTLSGWIGNLDITLGAGRDSVVVNGIAGEGVAVVHDFKPSEDSLRVLGLYPDGVNGLSGDFNDGTVRFAQEGADTVLQVDLFTTTSTPTWVTAVRLLNVDAHSIAIPYGLNIGTIPVLTGPNDPAFPSSPAPTDGPDNLTALAGATEIHAGGGDDAINGWITPDYLRGDDGDDTVTGGPVFDDINGNQGDDVLHGGPGDDWVVGGKDNDIQFGEQGGDVVWGNLGNDTLDGGDGIDQVRGGQGDDVIRGGAGDDYVSGDRGSDTITGGAGADLFHSFQEAGVDKVMDFNQAEGDRVMLDPGTTYTVSQVGADTVIDMGGGNQMILVNVQLSSLKDGWIFEG